MGGLLYIGKCKELSLGRHANDIYELHIVYYDDEDEFIGIAEPLIGSQKARLPEKLRKVIKKYWMMKRQVLEGRLSTIIFLLICVVGATYVHEHTKIAREGR